MSEMTKAERDNLARQRTLKDAAESLYQLLAVPWESISAKTLRRIVDRAEHLADVIEPEVARALRGDGDG